MPTSAGAAPATPTQGIAHATPGFTTLDACGYFYGWQTPAFTLTDGATTTQAGTWYGVYNNYYDSFVSSLGNVHGSFTETVTATEGALGIDYSGTETFTSNAGQIFQTFTYGPDVAGGYDVAVSATRALSFLTSNTNGACYTGTFPLS